ncbi:DegV family protein with EDD domain [Kineothrix alysoides]|uniref:DegV family protein with EDD domain n=1 Tax=Kineothrix alysoides TaxID=1469948 RepID=A0A4R1R6E7_9FIRM|nr:DegV family protein [Kineothrix alysoides]TCL61078.1 DegV family protein with EDD domain [Kineothrix alysoides]
MLRIITDSASDLPKQYVQDHKLHVIPTPVVIDEVDYLDGKTIQTAEFYNILDDTKRDIRTYHINPAMFEDAFLPYAEAGDSIIYLCFSTGIAGTFNAANIAKANILEKYPDFDLTIIDSKCASIGFGLLVSKLVTMLENGAPKEILIEAADYYISHVHHVFTVHTLAYLIKGGRLSKFKGTIAETLDMKPILIVDKSGSLQVIKTVRGHKKSLKALVDYTKENVYDASDQTIAFCHGEDEKALSFVLDLSDELLRPKDKLISTVGCAIGAHTGRGVIGICFFDTSDDKYKEYL